MTRRQFDRYVQGLSVQEMWKLRLSEAWGDILNLVGEGYYRLAFLAIEAHLGRVNVAAN
jgi:hypothetical protein